METNEEQPLESGRTTHHWGNGVSASETVIRAVADARGVDPLDLPALYRHVDLEALDQLLESMRRSESRDGQVSFTTENLRVTVTADGGVETTPADD